MIFLEKKKEKKMSKKGLYIVIKNKRENDNVHTTVSKVAGEELDLKKELEADYVSGMGVGDYFMYIDDVGMLLDNKIVVEFNDGSRVAGNMVVVKRIGTSGEDILFDDEEDVKKALAWLLDSRLLTKEEISNIDLSMSITTIDRDGKSKTDIVDAKELFNAMEKGKEEYNKSTKDT